MVIEAAKKKAFDKLQAAIKDHDQAVINYALAGREDMDKAEEVYTKAWKDYEDSKKKF